MPLLDSLRHVLTEHRQHVAGQTNSGALVVVDRHLAQLDAVAGDVEKGDAEVHRVLGELYAALNGPTPELATGGVVSGPVTLDVSAAPPTGIGQAVRQFLTSADSTGHTAPLATDAPGIAAEDQAIAAARQVLAEPESVEHDADPQHPEGAV